MIDSEDEDVFADVDLGLEDDLVEQVVVVAVLFGVEALDEHFGGEDHGVHCLDFLEQLDVGGFVEEQLRFEDGARGARSSRAT